MLFFRLSGSIGLSRIGERLEKRDKNNKSKRRITFKQDKDIVLLRIYLAFEPILSLHSNSNDAGWETMSKRLRKDEKHQSSPTERHYSNSFLLMIIVTFIDTQAIAYIRFCQKNQPRLKEKFHIKKLRLKSLVNRGEKNLWVKYAFQESKYQK